MMKASAGETINHFCSNQYPLIPCYHHQVLRRLRGRSAVLWTGDRCIRISGIIFKLMSRVYGRTHHQSGQEAAGMTSTFSQLDVVFSLSGRFGRGHFSLSWVTPVVTRGLVSSSLPMLTLSSMSSTNCAASVPPRRPGPSLSPQRMEVIRLQSLRGRALQPQVRPPIVTAG